MGQRNVNLDELEARITNQVEKEMQALAANLLAALYMHTDALKDMPKLEKQLMAAEKKLKAKKSRAGTTQGGK